MFFGSAAGHPLTLATAPETERLQSHDPSGVLGFNWGIDPASPEQVHEAQASMERRPPLLDHDALADSLVDHRTIYHFFSKSKWRGTCWKSRELSRSGLAVTHPIRHLRHRSISIEKIAARLHQWSILMPEAVLVSAVRTPVGRAPKGALSTTRPDDLAAIALGGALERVPGLEQSRDRRRDPRLRAAGGRAGLERGALGGAARAVFRSRFRAQR